MNLRKIIFLAIVILIIVMLAYLFVPQKDVEQERGADVLIMEDARVPAGAGDDIRIASAIARKYNKALGAVTVLTTGNNGSYARGSASFIYEDGGGIWFAAKREGKWTLVSEGRGATPCGLLIAQSFPSDIIPECR